MVCLSLSATRGHTQKEVSSPEAKHPGLLTLDFPPPALLENNFCRLCHSVWGVLL